MSLPQEPYTRIERYLAKLAGQDVDIPDTPITRIECYLAYLCDNGGGGGGYTPAPNAGAHNAIFRGQSLGDEFTAAQSAATVGGTFEDMYIGDYWTIGGKVYRIAGFNLFLNNGSSGGLFTDNHIVVVPDAGMYQYAFNATLTTDGGYLGSDLKVNGLATALATVEEAFGASHVLTRKSYFCSNATSGVPSSSGAWTDTQIDLMSEAQVYGMCVWTAAPIGFQIGERYGQFPLFLLSPAHIHTGVLYSLQDVRDATTFAAVGRGGTAWMINANTKADIRPYFCIA